MSNSLLKKSVTPQEKKIISEVCRDILESLGENFGSNMRKRGLLPNQPLCSHFLKRGIVHPFKKVYPFNQDAKKHNYSFFSELCDNKLYENPRRLAFIKRWAKKNLDAQA